MKKAILLCSALAIAAFLSGCCYNSAWWENGGSMFGWRSVDKDKQPEKAPVKQEDAAK